MKKSVSLDKALAKTFEKVFKFDESVDVAIHLPTDFSVKSYCDLPNPFPSAKIIAFSASQLELSDRVLVANESMISSIDTKKSLVAGFKYSVASPSLMPKISKIARILGPRGLMPDAKLGMVVDDVESAAKKILEGRVFLKSGKNGLLHVKVGCSSIGIEKTKQNIVHLLSHVRELRPRNLSSSSYTKSVSLSSTMGYGFFVDISS